MKLRLSRSDLILIFLLFVVFITSLSSLFMFNFDILFENSKQERVGSVIYSVNDVRQKNNSSYSWNQIGQNTQINYGDQIFVGPKSSAIVELEDGSQMKVSENSLVKFEKKKDFAKLFVSYGEVKTDVVKGGIELNICGEDHLIQSENSDSVVSISNSKDCKTMNIKAAKGKVKISKKFEVIVKTKPESIFKVLIPEAIRPEPIVVAPPPEPEIVLASPQLSKVNETLPAKINQTHKISWRPVEHADKYRVLVSENKEMEKPIIYETDKTFLNIKVRENNDVYFYRVIALNTVKSLETRSRLGRFEVTYPQLVINRNIKKINFKARTSQDFGKAVKIPAEWTNIPKAETYEIEVSKNKTFDEINSVIKTRSPASEIEVPGLGQYYYRVNAFNQNGRKIGTSANVGEIDYTRTFDLIKPEISSDAKKMVLFFQKTNGQFIRLKWSNPNKSKAPNQIIEMSDSPNFSKIIKRWVSTSEGYSINESIAAGTYFWRVKAHNQHAVSDWSDSAEIKIVGKSGPVAKPTVNPVQPSERAPANGTTALPIPIEDDPALRPAPAMDLE